MSISAILRIFAILVGVSPAAHAAPILDQEYDPVSDGAAGITTSSLSQTFTAGVTGLLTRVDLFVNTASTGNVTIAILDGPPTGAFSILGQVDVPAASFPPDGTAFTGTPINLSLLGILVSAGEDYAIRLTPNDNLMLWNIEPGTYAGGNAFVDANSLTTSDLGFRTFVDADLIPEPGTLALLGATLAAFAATRRGRKRSALA